MKRMHQINQQNYNFFFKAIIKAKKQKKKMEIESPLIGLINYHMYIAHACIAL